MTTSALAPTGAESARCRSDLRSKIATRQMHAAVNLDGAGSTRALWSPGEEIIPRAAAEEDCRAGPAPVMLAVEGTAQQALLPASWHRKE